VTIGALAPGALLTPGEVLFCAKAAVAAASARVSIVVRSGFIEAS
jgi:hypothetical protein